MANRPRGFGMAAEEQKKTDAAAFDPELAEEVEKWVEAMLKHGGEDSQADAISAADFGSEGGIAHALKDGQALDKLVNILQPGSVGTISDSKMAFKQMQNIGSYPE